LKKILILVLILIISLISVSAEDIPDCSTWEIQVTDGSDNALPGTYLLNITLDDDSDESSPFYSNVSSVTTTANGWTNLTYCGINPPPNSKIYTFFRRDSVLKFSEQSTPVFYAFNVRYADLSSINGTQINSSISNLGVAIGFNSTTNATHYDVLDNSTLNHRIDQRNTNASTECSNGEYLDGSGNCIDLNTTISQLDTNLTNGGNVYATIEWQDNINACFGTSGDSCVTYDGVNTIWNPDTVGSGAFVVDGDIDRQGVLRASQNGSSSYELILLLSGDNTFIDTSGENNDGTANNQVAATSKGMFGRAFSFDGTTDYISVADADEFGYINTGNYTWGGWMYLQGGTQIMMKHECNDAGASRDDGLFINLIGGQVCISESTGGDASCSTSSVPTNEWTHWVIVQDGNAQQHRVYFNGVLESTTSYSYGDELGENLYIGSDTATTEAACDGTDFQGLMDEIIIYNRTLSDGEVRGLYEKNEEFIPLKGLARTEDGLLVGDGSLLTNLPTQTTNLNDTNLNLTVLNVSSTSQFTGLATFVGNIKLYNNVNLSFGSESNSTFRFNNSDTILDLSQGGGNFIIQF